MFGAEIGYHLWRLAPAAGLAGLFPSLTELGDGLKRAPSGIFNVITSFRGPALQYADLAALAWLAGALLLGGLFAFGQWRFERGAKAGRAGPAATGFWPRMVVPAGYAARFTLEERALIRAHERAHMDRRDPTSNLLIAFLQVISWFNPLAHLAAALARMDQELSIDAKVISNHPKGRRRYAETLLKAHAHGLNSPPGLRPGARPQTSPGGAPGHARHAQGQRPARRGWRPAGGSAGRGRGARGADAGAGLTG
ncbi:MAG: M56 family metallopeptidase [Caulobacteraceae bacterium]